MDNKLTPARRKQVIRDNVAGWLFTLPSTLVLLVFTFLPAFVVVGLSLFDTNLVGQMDFVGLDNFRQLLTSGDFWGSVWRTLYFTIGSVPVAVAVSLLIAVLLNAKVRGADVLASGVLHPVYHAAGRHVHHLALHLQPRLWHAQRGAALRGSASQQVADRYGIGDACDDPVLDVA